MITELSTSTDETAPTGKNESSENQSTDAPEKTSKKLPADGIVSVDEYREVIDDALETCREKFDELLEEVSLEFSDAGAASDATGEPSEFANGDRREP